MEQLNHLIKDASNQFECHNFKTSLSLYVRCITKCQQEKLPTSILHNLKSCEAALRTILGQYESALNIVNQVLQTNKHHWLCLLRRSQIFKKQNKYKKAMKDLDTLMMYAPDNMQVAALKIQIRSLMKKNNQSSESQDLEESGDEVDEEELLKFSGLKKIDRTSFSIMVPKVRQSRVTLSGDTSFFYEEAHDLNDKTARKSSMFTPQFIRQKLIEIDNDLQEDEKIRNYQDIAAAKIKTKNVGRTKSILKNRNSQLYISNQSISQSKQSTHKFAEKLKNIEGKTIVSQTSSVISIGQKQVNFRKSLYGQDSLIQTNLVKKPMGRKSCLKRSSFSKHNEEQIAPKQKKSRKSKFQMMSRSSIDGKMIKSNKKQKEHDSEGDKQNDRANDSDSEEGSQYNIYGSKKVDIPKQLKENLNWSESDVNSTTIIPKNKKERTKSILKKDSIVALKKPKGKVSLFFPEEQKPVQEVKKQRKVKKSVMFNAG